MKLKKLQIVIIFFLALTAGCSQQHSLYKIDIIKREGISARIEDVIGEYPQNKAHWGIIVQNEAGDKLYSLSSEQLFVPASTLKLITAATLWNTLGQEYRIPTFIGYNGFTNNNILFGDLIVTGTGDPTLDKRHWRDPENVFKAWADSLRMHGISEIRGDVVGNDDLFEEQHLGYGWAWEDLSFPFSAEFGPLMVNNTTVEITLLPPQNNTKEITFIDNLPFPYLNYENLITVSDTLEEGVHARRLTGLNMVSLFGKFNSTSGAANKSVTASNPTLYYASLLKSILENNGILISGKSRDIDELTEKPQTITPLFTSYSPQLQYVIREFLQDSNNQAGEALLRTMAWQETGYGSFENGKLYVEVYLETLGISRLDYNYKDACGLSRYNLLSPVVLNKVLLAMQNSPEWEKCLPQPGLPGTLEKRLNDLSPEIYAKTGSMSGISCLSGYLYNGNKKLVFSIMVNNYNNPQKASELIDQIIYLLNN
ncbi:MAG: D-alanyl-D-alanine carboxypeptidase/D-alanyl-D-alanine-endopeptidase [Candidatus Cloacimonetes bacterium]|nr:D-alanyl-D-alanine carboxypeptidase/D-alanyl-D-alanine-endopeptidase [Candidatus Cloacimonadota bacterium]